MLPFLMRFFRNIFKDIFADIAISLMTDLQKDLDPNFAQKSLIYASSCVSVHYPFLGTSTQHCFTLVHIYVY
jgi:hypothetical protein